LDAAQNNGRFNFIGGVLLGLLLGAGLVWLLMPTNPEKLEVDVPQNLEKPQVAEATTINPTTVEKKEESALVAKKMPPREKTVIPEPDTLLLQAMEDSLRKADTVPVAVEVIDSTVADSSVFPVVQVDTSDSVQEKEEDIVILKERLVSSVKVQLLNLDPEAPANTKRDSLLEEVSGLREDKPKMSYIVEFWESPINYEGYKMGNNKVILFGLQSGQEKPELKQLQKKIYLKHQGIYYRIDDTFAFKALSQVVAPEVLEQLNQ